ncbi:MAG TPA: hypothetical protein VKZ60_07490 [Chloroflexota bacterium]|jgi:hypothetical protein|nr:hypothetical protein [Chloroflexota bacterium]
MPNDTLAGPAVVRTQLARVRAELTGLAAALQARLAAQPGAAAAEALAAARAAEQGLARVEAWLAACARGAAVEAVPAEPPRAEPPAGDPVARLATLLAASSEVLDAVGERLEAADPIAHFDAVQAVGLATAVLEASFQRLLRAGLAAPRPLRWH